MSNRFSNALNALIGRQAPAPRARKQAPYVFPQFVNGMPHWVLADFQAYVNEGYSINSIIYSAVNYKAKALAKAPLRAYTGDRESPTLLPILHPLQALCARPNPHQSWVEFQQQRETYLNVSGNSYTFLDRKERDGVPVALWNLRPDRVWIVPGEREIKGFLYVPERQPNGKIPILPRDLIHVKFPNPWDPLEGLGYGLSPMAAMAQSGDVDNAITAYLKLFFERGAMPSGIIKASVPLSPDQVATIRERWRETYGGFENWSDVAVLDEQSEYQRLGLTFDEMNFDKIDARNESRMIAPFGVPPMLIFARYGMEQSSYANMEEARKALWEDTLLPELDLFWSDDSYYLDNNGAFVQYDLSKIPALQVNTGLLIDGAYKLWTMGMPANQAITSVGLRMKEFEGGDVAFISGSLKTPDQVENPPAPQPLLGGGNGVAVASANGDQSGAGVDAANDTRAAPKK